MLHHDTARIHKRIAEAKEKIELDANDYKSKSNYAVNVMKLGKVDEALEILKELQLSYPNEYNINANLGTAYELSGQLDSAYKYISKGYKMNRNSHRGSEWIHVKILEAKIKAKGNPAWFRSHSIIDVDSIIRKVKTGGNIRYYLQTFERHLQYQIRTRAPFTPSPNMVIANLLVSMGDVESEVGTYENGILAYAYALEFQYDPSYERMIKSKIKAFNKKHKDVGRGVPDEFIHMMIKSEINPELLTIGLLEVSERLDSVHLAEVAHHDSLDVLKSQLDSTLKAGSENENKLLEEVTAAEQKGIQYLIAGIIGGLAIGFGIGFILKRKK